jgi:hypothetical protein
MQTRVVGHEIPVSAGAEARCRGCATQTCPPSVVASITVVDEGGADEDGADEDVADEDVGEEVTVLAVPAPGVPTAQQRSALAQDTASS